MIKEKEENIKRMIDEGPEFIAKKKILSLSPRGNR